MSMRVAVVGAGSWGTTVASLCAPKASTILWARRAELARELTEARTNRAYLPGFDLHPLLRATASLPEAVHDADLVLVGVPAKAMRATVRGFAPHLRPHVPVVSLAKGLEAGTTRRMTEVIAEELGGSGAHPIGALTGPNLAKEVLAGQAAATVLAMTDEATAEVIGELLRSETFRVYTNADVVGCEIAGALKNVIAIASGMAQGLGLGDNARAAVITRGLAELTRLGVAMGGAERTFAGLAGMGDLIATCMSPQSRNRHVGEQLGRGRPIREVVEEMRMVAEGVATSLVAVELGARHGVELPIAEQVRAVCHEGRSPSEAYRVLLARRGGAEVHGVGAE